MISQNTIEWFYLNLDYDSVEKVRKYEFLEKFMGHCDDQLKPVTHPVLGWVILYSNPT